MLGAEMRNLSNIHGGLEQTLNIFDSFSAQLREKPPFMFYTKYLANYLVEAAGTVPFV